MTGSTASARDSWRGHLDTCTRPDEIEQKPAVHPFVMVKRFKSTRTGGADPPRPPDSAAHPDCSDSLKAGVEEVDKLMLLATCRRHAVQTICPDFRNNGYREKNGHQL